ncbi:MAG: xylulokinase [Salinispira sp.]
MITTAEKTKIRECIELGACYLGLECGSTRIKATLVSPEGVPLAFGTHAWENTMVDGMWTYDLDQVKKGMASCFADLRRDVIRNYEVSFSRFAAAGFSAMMHGYLVCDSEGKLLVPFRTWRNNITGTASEELTQLFHFAIPQRWSIAHLHQAILNGEEHVGNISFITTLSGYVHWQLSGKKVLGIGDASGMFPVDPKTADFDRRMLEAYDKHIANRGYSWSIRDILPRVLSAGEAAGSIHGDGAALLDPTGELEAGIPLCPPEGDAGTGMVATNSIEPRRGNVSVGTSVFAMIVLEENLRSVHEEIDIVATPDGNPVAMVHSNNGTSDFDAWMNVFSQVCTAMGVQVPTDDFYRTLMPLILQSDADAGGLLSIGYVSGEHITGFTEGRPLVVRTPESNFTLPNFLRSLVLSSFCALRIGLDILREKEGVVIDSLKGHGGIFRTAEVGQKMLAAAAAVPVSVAASAGEGGAWGMALLAAYLDRKSEFPELRNLLDSVVGDSETKVAPDPKDMDGFLNFFRRYQAGLSIEQAAIESM